MKTIPLTFEALREYAVKRGYRLVRDAREGCFTIYLPESKGPGTAYAFLVSLREVAEWLEVETVAP